MSNEELVERAQSGEKEVLSVLYKNNEGITKRICRRFAEDDFEFEDLMQDSYFVLLSAVYGYKPDKGIKFITYYTKALTLNLLRYKHYHGRKESLTLNVPINYEEGSEERIDNIPDPNTPDPNERLEMEFLRQQLEQALRRLPERQAYILTQYYCKERPISELANVFQTTVKEVWHDIKMGRKQLVRDELLRKAWFYWTGYYWDTDAYKGGLRMFRNTCTSSTERVALNNIYAEERILSFLSRMKEGEVS